MFDWETANQSAVHITCQTGELSCWDTLQPSATVDSV